MQWLYKLVYFGHLLTPINYLPLDKIKFYVSLEKAYILNML